MITFLKFNKVKSLVRRMLSAFPFKFGLFNLNCFLSIFSPFFVSKKIPLPACPVEQEIFKNGTEPTQQCKVHRTK